MTSMQHHRPPALPARLRSAHVRRPHGVRGAVRAEPLGGDAGRFMPGMRLWRESDGSALTVRDARAAGDDVLLVFDEVGDRTGAEALRDEYLCVEAPDARPLAPDEWFVHQLVGLRVQTPDGRELGRVVDIEAYVEHDVVVVDGPGGVRRLPLARAFVRSVDIAAGVVVATPWSEEA